MIFNCLLCGEEKLLFTSTRQICNCNFSYYLFSKSISGETYIKATYFSDMVAVYADINISDTSNFYQIRIRHPRTSALLYIYDHPNQLKSYFKLKAFI